LSTESGPGAADGAAFDLFVAGGDDAAAALCLHGLTGTPYEVRSIAHALVDCGIRAFGPALPGHNATPEDLVATSHREWLDAAVGHYRDLRKRHERVFAVGMSMGGLVTLWLAAQEPVDGVVVIGAPLRLRHPFVFLAPLVKFVKPFLPKRGGSDIRDPEARARHPGYPVMPVAAVHELQRLQSRDRPVLSRITAPILVAHGAHDRTANPDDARRVFESVASDEKELLLLENSGHVVPVDFDGPHLAVTAADFLARHV
jgi:carboxylesterase